MWYNVFLWALFSSIFIHSGCHHRLSHPEKTCSRKVFMFHFKFKVLFILKSDLDLLLDNLSHGSPHSALYLLCYQCSCLLCLLHFWDHYVYMVLYFLNTYFYLFLIFSLESKHSVYISIIIHYTNTLINFCIDHKNIIWLYATNSDS